MFFYKRKKARWISLLTTVEQMTETPVQFTEQYLNRKIDINFDTEGLPELAFKLEPPKRSVIVSLKVIAVFLAIWSLLLLITETTLIFSPKNFVSAFLNGNRSNVWLTFTFTTLVLVGVIATAFFTIFKLKFSDYYQMVFQHTDAITMATFSGLWS
jgi:hypothetical protein